MVAGRWTLTISRTGEQVFAHLPLLNIGEKRVPVVPCDEEALERVAFALKQCFGGRDIDTRQLAREALRAAGETPA